MIRTEDNITYFICDSCHNKIAVCENFYLFDDQELVYSPLLCESCGQKHNKDVGDDVQRLIRLEKFFRTLGKGGYDFKYIDEKDGKEIQK